MLKRIRGWLEEFLFPAKAKTWIAILRVGLGLVVTIYSLSLWHDWNYLFGASGSGLISRDIAEVILSFESPFIPRLEWLVTPAERFGLSEETALTFALGCLLGSGVLLLIGFFCRSAAITAWLFHLATRGSGGFTAYGVDNFMTIGLFYLMLSPLPDRYSLDAQLWRVRAVDLSRVGFHQRILQLHLCLIYFFGGLAKCLGAGWWNGASIWRAMTRSPFNIIPTEILLQWSYLFPVVGVSICLLEIGYSFMIWPQKSRLVWLSFILAMHTAIGFAMGLHLFALIMVVLNLSAFGPGALAAWSTKGRKSPSPILPQGLLPGK